MLRLAAGIALFVGVHSIRLGGEGLRDRLVARLGETPYKLAYAGLSLLGLVLIGQGWSAARDAGLAPLYDPPAALRHLSLVLVPVALVLLVSAYAPAGRIKALARQPMVLGVALWALAHLLANGGAAEVLLFGAFFVWAAATYVSENRRDAKAGIVRRAKGVRGDAIALVVGLGVSAALIVGGHQWLFGVAPLG